VVEYSDLTNLLSLPDKNHLKCKKRLEAIYDTLIEKEHIDTSSIPNLFSGEQLGYNKIIAGARVTKRLDGGLLNKSKYVANLCAQLIFGAAL